MYTVKIWASSARAAFEAVLQAGHHPVAVRPVRHGYSVTCQRGSAAIADVAS